MKSIIRNRAVVALMAVTVMTTAVMADDTIPGGFSRPVEWRVGAEFTPSHVIATNSFLKGDNPERRRVGANLSGDIRADFSFAPSTREGMLYRGLYQGLGVGVDTYFSGGVMGTPASAYVYQGAPSYYFSNRLWLGYEWQFGAAFGWKHNNEETAANNYAVSTAVTAHMGIALKINYSLGDRWLMSLGIQANHYSNGNTSWPNAGVNSIGMSVGVAYVINPADTGSERDRMLESDADRHVWFYDIVVYGAWRKRAVTIGTPPEPELCPGKFGVVGMQFSPMYSLNRWVAVGTGIDAQWDESADLSRHWVEGSYAPDLRFRRPSFGKQLSVGLSAHAELTMPIFSVNAGIGYAVVNPRGDKAFYQSLTLKTFVTRHLYLNTGYRLGRFKDPQNLMLGIGIRL